MKIITALTLLALCMPLVARAAPVTYAFRGFVEHDPRAPGYKPPNYDTLVPVKIVLDNSVAGTVSGNTEVYGANCNTPGGGPDPVLLITIDGKKIAPGGCNDSVTITTDANGPSSITVFVYQVQVGAATFTFNGGALSSSSIPAKIDTLQFMTATFTSNFPVAVGEGALATRE